MYIENGWSLCTTVHVLMYMEATGRVIKKKCLTLNKTKCSPAFKKNLGSTSKWSKFGKDASLLNG
jgi:hypothetical protein